MNDEALVGEHFGLSVAKQTDKGSYANLAFTKVKRSAGGLDVNVTSEPTGEIDNDRQGKDFIVIGEDYMAEFSQLMRLGFAPLLLDAICASEVSRVIDDATVEITATGLSSSAQFGDLQTGDLVWVTGANAAVDNRCYLINKVDDSTLTTTPQPSTAEAASGNIVITLSLIHI